MDKLIIKSRNQTELVDFNDIISLNAQGRYTHIITQSKNHLSCKNLSTLEPDLPEYFFRIHYSYIINVHHVIKLNGEKATMTNGEIHKIAKNRKKKFSDFIRNLCNNHKSGSNKSSEK